MKHNNSRIGKHGIRWIAIEEYKKKNGKKVQPHMKKSEFKWPAN
jgi:hypothetical protein